MLKIRIVAIGEHKDVWITQGCEHYVKLLSKYASVELKTVRSPKLSPTLTPEEIQKAEAIPLLQEFGRGLTIALADSGKQFDTPKFARQLESWQASSGGVVTFFIGGPFGLHAEILKKADVVLSLSPLTFSHQLVRLVLLEQLYRAYTILAGTGYHK